MPDADGTVASPASQTDGITPRRTFAVEFRVDGEAGQVVTTKVSHLETQESQGWPGWDPARLLGFLQSRIAEPQPAPRDGHNATTQTPIAGRADPRLHPHRYGVVRCADVAGGAVQARLRLDTAALALPVDGQVVARVKLLGEPLGGTPVQLLDSRQVAFAHDAAPEVVMSGQPADPARLSRIFATVVVLVEQPAGPPVGDLGSATLQRLVDRTSS